MSATEELIKLILSVVGEDAVVALTGKLDDNRASAEKLTAAYHAGDVTTEEYFKTVKKLNSETALLQSVVDGLKVKIASQDDALSDAARDGATLYAMALEEISEKSEHAHKGLGKVGTTADDSKKQAAALGRAFLEFSRGVEDFTTGGPLGVLNNLPGIFSAGGQAAGLSAAQIAGLTSGVSLLATGAYILYQNWDRIAKLWGEHKTETEAEEMERLEKATSKTADQTKRLADLKDKERDKKDTANEIERLEKLKTDAEKGAGEGVTKTVAAVGGLDDAIRLYVKQAMSREDPRGELAANDPARAAQIKEGYEKAFREAFAQASRGDIGMRDTLLSEAERSKDPNLRGFGLLMRANTPETAKAAVKEIEQKQADEYIQGLWDQQKAKDRRDKEEGEREAEALQAREREKQETAAKKSLEDSKKAIAAKQKQDAADAFKQGNEQAKYRGEVLNSANDVTNQNPGINPQAAIRVAEEAVALHKNFGIPMAQAQMEAMQALMQGFSAVQAAYQRQRQQMAIMQANINRSRTMMPTAQPIPFTN